MELEGTTNGPGAQGLRKRPSPLYHQQGHVRIVYVRIIFTDVLREHALNMGITALPTNSHKKDQKYGLKKW